MNDSKQILPEQEILGLLSGRSDENPFPLFKQLRGKSSVIPIPFPIGGPDNQAWIVTKFEDAMNVLKNHTQFSVDPNSINLSNGNNQTLSDTTDQSSSLFLSNSLNALDEPDHRRLRMLVSKAFTPRYMEGLRPQIQKIADELLDQVQDKGEMDLVKDYAFPLPIRVISDMIGVPNSDNSKIYVWSEAIANGLGLGRHDPEVTENLQAFADYIKLLISEKRKKPSNDLISELILIEEQGDRLSETELISMIQLLIFAGHETTSNLISTGALVLLDNPDQLAMLKADHSLIPSAVEELLRFNGPVTIAGLRYALENLELGGEKIQKGDVILPLVKSANRDEQQFTDSEELDITRKIKHHLAFGQGIHKCLGAPLARIEADIAFTSLLKRMPNLRISIPRENVNWQYKLATQGLTSLPVSF